jgi:two-component system, OmpR family, sensor kinase
VERMRGLAGGRGIALEGELEPAWVRGDPDRLRQVILNLVTNGIQHNREGGKVRVSCRVENGHSVLAVSDTGPGISPEHLPHLFERFYRVDMARAGRSDGAGLGLAICKAIIEAHGGRMEVESQPGSGATFSLRLPRETTGA